MVIISPPVCWPAGGLRRSSIERFHDRAHHNSKLSNQDVRDVPLRCGQAHWPCRPFRALIPLVSGFDQ